MASTEPRPATEQRRRRAPPLKDGVAKRNCRRGHGDASCRTGHGQHNSSRYVGGREVSLLCAKGSWAPVPIGHRVLSASTLAAPALTAWRGTEQPCTCAQTACLIQFQPFSTSIGFGHGPITSSCYGLEQQLFSLICPCSSLSVLGSE